MLLYVFNSIISAGVGAFVSHMGPGLVWRLWPAWAGAMDMGELEEGREGGREGGADRYSYEVATKFQHCRFGSKKSM